MERIAVVGSRKGVERHLVEDFIRALAAGQPDSVVVSGGAVGVDSWAEQAWLAAGGRVVSFRPYQHTQDSWGVEEWTLGMDTPGVVRHNVPTFADPKSALLYRSTMIVDNADRVVSFTNPRFSPGTRFTKAYARDRGIPVYEMNERKA